MIIETEYDKTLVLREDAKGMARYRENKIMLLPDTPTYLMTREMTGQAYCHELIHHILDHMGEEKLRTNEKFVELAGQLLFQALDSAEYGGKK